MSAVAGSVPIAADLPPAAVQPESAAAAGTRTFLRGSTLLLVGRILSLALNFAVQILTIRYLAKDAYGAFAYGVGIVTTGSAALLMGLDKATARFVSIYLERGQLRRMFGAMALATAIIWGLGVSGMVVVYGFRGILAWGAPDRLSASLLLILIALIPVAACDGLLQALMAVFMGARAIFFRRYVLGPGLKLLAVLLVIGVAGSVQLLAVGYLVGGTLGVALYVFLLFRTWQHRQLLRHARITSGDVPARELLGYALPLLSTELVLVLRDSLPAILLGHMQSTRAVAEYQAVLPVAKLNIFVLQAFSFLFLPLASRLFARSDRRGLDDLYWRTTLWVALLSFPVFAATAALARPLTLLLFGERYVASAPILAVLAVGHYVYASFGFNGLTLRVCGNVGYAIFADITAFLVGLGLNLLLIPRYGALGAAVGTTGTFIIHCGLNTVGLRVGGTGVRMLDRAFVGIWLRAAAALVGLALLHLWFRPPTVVDIAAVAVACTAVLYSARHALRAAETFPELLRVPFVRRLLT